MTTVTYTPPTARSNFEDLKRQPRLTFAGIVRSERIKFTSLRSFRITLAITLLAGLGLALLGGYAMTSMFRALELEIADLAAADRQGYLLDIATSSSPFLALIFGVLGVFAISSEYSSGMVLSSLAAVPKRTPMYAAKALVVALVSGTTALVLAAVGLAIAVLFVPEAGSEIITGTVISGVTGMIAYLVLVTLLGFGVAAILRSTAGGVSVLVGLIFVLPVGFQFLLLTDWEWVPNVVNYLPMSLGSILAGGIHTEGNPGFTVALIAMVVWTVIPCLAGYALLKSRDAK